MANVPAAVPRPGLSTMGKLRASITERPLWLMIPGLLLLLCLVVAPFAVGGWISFLDLDETTLRDWLSAPIVGTANYIEALQSAGMLHSLWVSTSFSVLTTAIAAPIGLLAALTVQGRFRGRAFVRSLYLVPYVIPGFVTGLLWRFILQPSGAGNRILELLGFSGDVNWLIGERAFWTIVFVDVWASWAFVYLMALAGLQTIPVELYEAAEVDGAGFLQKLRHIVVPQLRGVLSLGLLLSTMHHFNNFTLPYVIFGAPAPEAVNLLPINVFTTSFQQFRFGLGAAMSVLTLIILLAPAAFYLRATRLETSEEDA